MFDAADVESMVLIQLGRHRPLEDSRNEGSDPYVKIEVETKEHTFPLPLTENVFGFVSVDYSTFYADFLEGASYFLIVNNLFATHRHRRTYHAD